MALLVHDVTWLWYGSTENHYSPTVKINDENYSNFLYKDIMWFLKT